MKLSVVTTLYYSQEYVREFHRRVVSSIRKITDQYEIIFVNDGSPDQSLQRVLELQRTDPNVVVVDLSRNFGHHKAIMTGLRFAKGDYVFLIDVDLEEDPELLDRYWAEIRGSEGVDVVFGIQKERKGGFFERISGRIFYGVFSLLAAIDYPHDTLTARLMTRRYVANVISYRETELDIWGLFVLTGFNQKGVYVTKGSKGTSTYTLKKKLKMAVETITSFSSRPLYLIFLFGVFIIIAAFANILVIIYKKILYGVAVEGWASLLTTIWLVGGIIIFLLGVIGMYLSKMFTEIKNRPFTIVREVYGRENPGAGNRSDQLNTISDAGQNR
jgi:putative glycosyltransferase